MRTITGKLPPPDRKTSGNESAGVQQLFAQGLDLYKKGKLAEAKQCLRRLLAAQPAHAEALHALGVIAAQQGNPVQAIKLIDRALAVRPDYALAYYNRGNALKDSGQIDAAIASYDRAIDIKPEFPAAISSRKILKQWKQGAAARLVTANKQGAPAPAPKTAAEFFKRALKLMEQKRFKEALAGYDQAIALKPHFAEAYCCRGIALKKLKHIEAAIDSYSRAIAIKPDLPEAYNNRGLALQNLKQPDGAIADYDQAIALKPDYVNAYINRGNTLLGVHRHKAAIASYNRAVAWQPTEKTAFNNRGVALQALKRIDAAIASHHKALRIDPDYAGSHWNLSMALLLKGDFENGWRHYEWRWKYEGISTYRSRRNFSQPQWLGNESLKGKTILLHAEQGLGDALQFCRYAKTVAGLGAKVILEVHPALVNVLQGLDGVEVLLPRKAALPPFDFHCPLLSLPLAFRTDLDTIPSDAGYVHSDQQKTAEWRQRLGRKRKPRIGLVWSGGTKHARDAERSIPLSELIPLLADGFEFVCLQKEVRKTDLAVLRKHPEIRHFGPQLEDFTDTAALCGLMDLVISVDTSVAHLAGAMGRPLWMLLPWVPDWRWLLDRDDSPWYPSARLFRQPEPGDWTTVIKRVRAELAAGSFRKPVPSR